MAGSEPPYSSYAVVTAQRLLEKHRIQLSQNEVRDLLKSHKTFYYRLLTLPAQAVNIKRIIEQFADEHASAQQDLNDIYYTRFITEAKAKSMQQDNPLSKNPELNALREAVENQYDTAKTLTTDQKKLAQSIEQDIGQLIEKWHNSVQEHAAQMVRVLEQKGYDLPATFEKTLLKQLMKQGVGSQVSEDDLSKAGVKSDPHQIYTAIIATCKQEFAHEPV